MLRQCRRSHHVALAKTQNDNQLTKLTGDARLLYRDVRGEKKPKRNAKVIIVM